MWVCKKLEMFSKRQTVEWFSGNNQTNGYLHHTEIVVHSIIDNLAWIKNKAICSKDYRIMTESLKPINFWCSQSLPIRFLFLWMILLNWKNGIFHFYLISKNVQLLWVDCNQYSKYYLIPITWTTNRSYECWVKIRKKYRKYNYK